MAVKRYTANSDTTITNAFENNLTTRGVDANMGASDILEIFSLYGAANSGSQELERILVKFPISDISNDRTIGDLPASGSVSFYLKMHNARHSQTLPRNFTLSAQKVITDWQEGIGLDMEGYRDKTYGNAGATWMSASNTTPWDLPGGDYAGTAYKQHFPIGTEDLELNITPLVEEWINGTANYGLEVKLTSSEEAYYADTYPRKAVFFDADAYLSGSGGYGESSNVSSSSGKSTISGWVRPDSAPFKVILSWMKPGSLISEAFQVKQDTLFNLQWSTRFESNGFLKLSTPEDSIPLNELTHIAATQDLNIVTASADSWPTIYVNGISQSLTLKSETIGETSNPVQMDNFSIGGTLAAPGLFVFEGLIDDVSFYDKELSAAEILEIYNGGCPNDLRGNSSADALKNWWINGDNPEDVIHLGEPPTLVSIYDQIGTANLYATGSGGMAITGSDICAGGILSRNPGTGQLVNLGGSTLNYYTKKFFAHSSEFFFKRPVIEARWESALKDDRGRLHLSSTILPVEDNTYTLYLYNIFGGRKRDIPAVGTGSIYMQLYGYTSATQPLLPTAITGGWVSTGFYSASFELSGALLSDYGSGGTINDRWFSGSQPDTASISTNIIFQGTTGPIQTYAPPAQTSYSALAAMHPANFQYWSNITNLQSNYTPTDQIRLRLYTRLKDWSPNIYTVATQDIETTIIPSASYQIYRVVDDLIVLAYGTGSDNSTMMSYDIAGNYFDLDMRLFEPDYAYGIKIAFYNENSWVEQPYTWKFRIEDLDRQ